MNPRIRNISFDCHDTYALAGFWSAVLGYARHDEDAPGDPEAALLPPDETLPNLFFQEVPEEKVTKNRLHICLEPVGRTMGEEIERVLGLGATLVADRRHADGTGWAVLADPEGNEFCVLRSAAERVHTTTVEDQL
ncbi:VOC family protein [Micromonospora parathelypteridis]|uniref:Putative enzyme related to lactoylglutathione lyase n=1 Tax=Micromonospora parathelypteridis TaxID=1839617 RepID=A0A840W6N0_9ACTN|nr:VOC family protein [Micromonospora parathelypteridis]MBB5479839.1 putative enzyme related to lactoylglutathione lyase [Micromonospora parathelypteridis]GGO26277.1 glyoxalase [Micromonospora parathelypteridis]